MAITVCEVLTLFVGGATVFGRETVQSRRRGKAFNSCVSHYLICYQAEALGPQRRAHQWTVLARSIVGVAGPLLVLWCAWKLAGVVGV